MRVSAILRGDSVRESARGEKVQPSVLLPHRPRVTPACIIVHAPAPPCVCTDRAERQGRAPPSGVIITAADAQHLCWQGVHRAPCSPRVLAPSRYSKHRPAGQHRSADIPINSLVTTIIITTATTAAARPALREGDADHLSTRLVRLAGLISPSPWCA